MKRYFRLLIKSLSLLLILFIVGGCSSAPSNATLNPEVAATPSKPTPTFTPMPLDKIDLGEVMVNSQELGYSFGVVKREHPRIWPLRDVPMGVNHLSRELLDAQGNSMGWIVIDLFESDDEAKEAYNLLEQNVWKVVRREGSKVQEQIVPGSDHSLAFEAINVRAGVAFVKCKGLGLVFLGMESNSDMSAAIYYANKLSSEIENIACP